MTGNSIFLKTAKKRIVFVSPLLLFFPFVLSLLAFPLLSLILTHSHQNFRFQVMFRHKLHSNKIATHVKNVPTLKK